MNVLFVNREDFEGLRFWHPERRAILGQHIQGHERALERWRERSEELGGAADLAGERFATFIEEERARLGDVPGAERDADGRPPP